MARLIHPDVPDASLTQNAVIRLDVCGLGVVAFSVALAVLRVALFSVGCEEAGTAITCPNACLVH